MLEKTQILNRHIFDCKGTGVFVGGILLIILGNLFILISLLFLSMDIVALIMGIFCITIGAVITKFAFIMMKNDFSNFNELRKNGKIIYAKIIKRHVRALNYVEIEATYFDTDKSQVIIFKEDRKVKVYVGFRINKLRNMSQIAVLTNNDYSKYYFLTEESINAHEMGLYNL